MSKRLEVITALKALLEAALPDAEVLGLDGDEEPPVRAGPGGLAIMRSGEPGDPEVDLCPPSYNYFHRVPVEIVSGKQGVLSAEQAVSAMAAAVGAAVEADRTLGGRCRYLDADAITTADIYADGGGVLRGADFDLVAEYATANPLT